MADERRQVITLSSRVGPARPIRYAPEQDYVSTFQNAHGDQWIFVREAGAATGSLYGSDLGWEPYEVWDRDPDEVLEALRRADPRGAAGAMMSGLVDPLLPQVGLTMAERTWLRTAWEASAPVTTDDERLRTIAVTVITRVRGTVGEALSRHPESAEYRSAAQALMLMLGREGGIRALDDDQVHRLVDLALTELNR